MTVIKGNKSYVVRPGSAQASDTESLHLESAPASDVESINNEPLTTRYLPNRSGLVRPVQVDDTLHLKKSSGKRKTRRYMNRCLLHTLKEEDDQESSLIVIVDPYKSPFARLLEDTEALKFWNDFVEKSENEQALIINAFYEKCQKQPPTYCNEEKSLGRVSSRIKRTFKTKKNLSIESVRDYELELLDFFNSNPQSVYVKIPPTTFDRLLLRAIAHYHGLDIHYINDSEVKCVEIFTKKEDWVPANCFLTDFIKQLR
ncbi:hypothetical protein ABEB36_011385 [Hypothenemus hampei]|uniref:R3H-associated N-terminal domain-containing protein n=1 Tax=Hypothenemus hampei TaxID=57062 RepID=A0ABD1EFV1_HYPHA